MYRNSTSDLNKLRKVQLCDGIKFDLFKKNHQNHLYTHHQLCWKYNCSLHVQKSNFLHASTCCSLIHCNGITQTIIVVCTGEFILINHSTEINYKTNLHIKYLIILIVAAKGRELLWGSNMVGWRSNQETCKTIQITCSQADYVWLVYKVKQQTVPWTN